MTITDFEEWLEEQDLSDYNDIDSLYQSVENCNNYDCFTTNLAKGSTERWVVSSDMCEDALLLVSEKARQSFLNMIEERYCDGMNEHAWYMYNKGMEEDD